MDWRNRIGIYGAYLLGMAGIGFTLPYLPLFLRQHGMSDRAIGVASTVAALAGLAQFPIGVWSDRIGRRKPFLAVALAVLAAATWLLRDVESVLWLGLLVVLFAENGLCRASAESLFGAEVAQLAPPGKVGAALGALRFWKPVGVIAMAITGGLIAERFGIESILAPLTVVQILAVIAALLIHEVKQPSNADPKGPAVEPEMGSDPQGLGLKDGVLWMFVVAMVLFHVANAPGGVYLGLFLRSDLGSSDKLLSWTFVISNVTWMLIVIPAGRLADRLGRKPLLIAGWAAMTVRLVLVALASAPWQVLAVQVLDGAAQGLFIVAAAAWVTDRIADHKRIGEAQVIVGCSLVAGSAIGPTLAGFAIEALGYRGMFWLLAGIGAIATTILVIAIPEATPSRRKPPEADKVGAWARGTHPVRRA